MNEFERIASFFAPLSAGFAGAFGLTDDIALINARQCLISTDTIIEGVHYIGDEPADLIARKLFRCTLSDLAAKGAVPLYYTLNMTLPSGNKPDDKWDEWLALFAGGLKVDQQAFGMHLIGGDSTVTKHGPAVLSMTAFGQLEEGKTPPLRSHAQVGDLVCVSGTIGDAALGLKIAQHQHLHADPAAADYLLNRYRLPMPRVTLGQALAPFMRAAMDVSDGLMQDAGHIAAASGVSVVIHANKIPLSPAGRQMLSDQPVTIAQLASGGDDYEILCTIDPGDLEQALRAANQDGVALTVIGEIEHGAKARLLDAQGVEIALHHSGYMHGA